MIAVKEMVTVRNISKADQEYWDEHVLSWESASPFNAYAWGQVRTTDGWEPLYLIVERSGRSCGCMLVLMRKVPMTPFSIFYSPRGPLIDWHDREALQALMATVQEYAKTRRAIFLRSDPNIPENSSDLVTDALESVGYVHLDQRWTFWNSPRDVSRVDLTRAKTTEELFQSLDGDARRRIRKAVTEGVVIERARGEDDLLEFYKAFRQFSVEKGFMARSYLYQKSLWDTFISSGHGNLFLAKEQGKIIGGLLCIMFAKKCIGMHAGTLGDYKSRPYSYVYQWEAIKWAKEQGCSYYSFRGVGTTPSQEQFKRKFRPGVVPLCGYYDLPFHPLIYKIWRFGEFTLLPEVWPILIFGRKFVSDVRSFIGQALLRLKPYGKETPSST